MSDIDEAMRRAARAVCGLPPDAEPSIGISVAGTAIKDALASLAASGWVLVPREAIDQVVAWKPAIAICAPDLGGALLAIDQLAAASKPGGGSCALCGNVGPKIPACIDIACPRRRTP